MNRKINSSTILDKDGKILLVQEGKEELRGQWNLPGGGLKEGEEVAKAAIRETLEEASVQVELTSLVGLYPQVGQTHSFNFVFAATIIEGEPAPSDDIINCQWMSEQEFAELGDDQLVSSQKLRKIIADYFQGIKFPLEVITEIKK